MRNKLFLLFALFTTFSHAQNHALPKIVRDDFCSIAKTNFEYGTDAFKVWMFQSATAIGMRTIVDIENAVESIDKHRNLQEEFFKNIYRIGGSRNFIFMQFRSIGMNAKNAQILADYIIEKYSKVKSENVADDIDQNRINEQAEQKKIEITSKTYDLQEYDTAAYNQVIKSMKSNIKKYLESSSLERFTVNSENKFRFTNSYNAYFRLEDHSRPSQSIGNVVYAGSDDIRQKKEIKLLCGTDSSCSLFNHISVYIPKIQIEGFEVMTEAHIKNISIDYAKGISIVKVKNGKVKFLESMPDTDLIEALNNEIRNKNNGKYYVRYRYINIMGEKSIQTEFEKKTVRIGFKTGIALVLIPTYVLSYILR